MNGIMITGIGIGLVILAVVLLTAAVIYRKTAGKKMREELGREYE